MEKFTLEITLGDDMRSPDDLAWALHRVANKVQGGTGNGKIRDLTGDFVGKFDIEKTPDPAPAAPMSRYRVIYSTDPSGSHIDFSAANDSAAWEHAEQRAYGARIVSLAEVHIRAGGDAVRELSRPAACPENDPACASQGCVEHPEHNGPDHTYEQHHSPKEHIGPDAASPQPDLCRCTVYLAQL